MSTREPVDRTARVAEPLRRLDARQFVAFCAALWTARGYETRVEGERVVATRDDERVVVLARAAPGRMRGAAGWVRAAVFTRQTAAENPADADVDVVATAAETAAAGRLAARLGARLVGPRALADCLLYGVHRGDADDLATRHLGASTEMLLTADRPRRDERDGRSGHPVSGAVEATPGVRSAGAVGVAAVVCLVAVAVGFGVLTAGDVGSAAGVTGVTDVADGGAEGGADPAADPAEDSTTAGETTAADRSGDAGTYPPGVGAGSLDVERLADAHTAAMDGRSYRLVVRHADNTTVGGSRRWEGTSWHATVESDRIWRSTVSRYADEGNGVERTGYSVYADGEFAYRRAGEGANASFARYPVRVREDGSGPVAERVRGHLHRYLATTVVRVYPPTRHVDTYRVVATGQPTRLDRDVTEYTAVAFVAPDGRVARLLVEYTSREGLEEETVQFRLAYTVVGEVTVQRPGWYDEATAATSGTAMRD